MLSVTALFCTLPLLSGWHCETSLCQLLIQFLPLTFFFYMEKTNNEQEMILISSGRSPHDGVTSLKKKKEAIHPVILGLDVAPNSKKHQISPGAS